MAAAGLLPQLEYRRRLVIEAVYAEWSALGAQFLTPPKQHEYEIRCYIRDPDGYLIEVGQTTAPGDWTPPQWLANTASGEPE